MPDSLVVGTYQGSPTIVCYFDFYKEASMHNPIDLAICHVVNNIPPQILEVALRTANKRYNEENHLAAFISEHIIDGRVRKEINISGGHVKTIALRSEWIERSRSEHAGFAGDDGPYTLYRIPPEFRDNMPISNVLSIQYPYNTYLGGGVGDLNLGTGGYNMNEMIQEVLNSYTLSTPRNHPVCRVLAGDLIKLTPSQYANQNWLLTVRINYDSAMTSLHAAAIPVFQELCLQAMRQWCYTNLYIDIDRAYMETGVDIGTFKEVLQSYSDAGQLYKEEMIKWRGVAQMDPSVRMRYIHYQL